MMAKLLKLSNLKKTIYYLKKNGLRKAYYAAVERASSERKDDYHYDPLPDSVLKEQAGKALSLIHILLAKDACSRVKLVNWSSWTIEVL